MMNRCHPHITRRVFIGQIVQRDRWTVCLTDRGEWNSPSCCNKKLLYYRVQCIPYNHRHICITYKTTRHYKCSAVAEMNDRLATIDTGRKEGDYCVPFRGGDGSASNTMWPGPRPTSVRSGILVYPAVWPQQTWAKN